MPWEYSNTPPGHDAPAAVTGDAPGHDAPPALSATAPGHDLPAALSDSAPGHDAPPAMTGAAPEHDAAPALSTTPPGHGTPPALTTQPTLPFSLDPAPAALPSMPSTFIPGFIDLDGVGPTLKTLTASAADAAAGRIVQGTVNGELRSYQVRAGADDEALPGIVRPANFDAETNAVVFVQL